MEIGTLIQDYGYPLVALGTFLEGESVLLAAGFAARQGHLSLAAVMIIAIVASFLGDQLYFWLGRRFGIGWLSRFVRAQPAIERTQQRIARYQRRTIFAVRFTYGFRIVGPIVLGMSPQVHWHTFLVFNALGALAWGVLMTLAGYYFAHLIDAMLGNVGHYEAWILIGIVVIGGAAHLLTRGRSRAH